ncbi:MAG: homoserine kinase [Alphaproteobacteria bacterium]|nr:homoserine kinase [Alphaproteobacteria bacterium]
MAVYTDVAIEELAAFLADYDVGSILAMKGIAEGVENSNYLVMTDGGSYILTLYEKRVKEEDLPFFLGLMEHLAARGVPCPTPIRDRKGRALKWLKGKAAALISFLEGVSPGVIEARHCSAVGEALAEMHLKGTDFPMHRPNALGLSSWNTLARQCRARADEVEPGLADEISRELDTLHERWPRGLPCGVIHADLFSDNVFFRGSRLTGLIDFYFACNDLLAYDIAVCLNAWCFTGEARFDVTRGHALIDAYSSRRPLDDAERASLSLLARGAALRFLLTRLYDWLNPVGGAIVTPKDPGEFLRLMRYHRHHPSLEP